MPVGLESRPFITPPHVGFSTPLKLFTCPADDRLGRAVTSPAGHTIAMTSYIGSADTFQDPESFSLLQVAKPGFFFDIATGSRMSDITDGTSNNIAMRERPPPNTFQAGGWYQRVWILDKFGGPDGVMFHMGPAGIVGAPCGLGSAFGPGRLDNPCDRLNFWSLHQGGCNFLYADGSVRFTPYSARDLIPALLTRSGGETASEI